MIYLEQIYHGFKQPFIKSTSRDSCNGSPAQHFNDLRLSWRDSQPVMRWAGLRNLVERVMINQWAWRWVCSPRDFAFLLGTRARVSQRCPPNRTEPPSTYVFHTSCGTQRDGEETWLPQNSVRLSVCLCHSSQIKLDEVTASPCVTLARANVLAGVVRELEPKRRTREGAIAAQQLRGGDIVKCSRI